METVLKSIWGDIKHPKAKGRETWKASCYQIPSTFPLKPTTVASRNGVQSSKMHIKKYQMIKCKSSNCVVDGCHSSKKQTSLRGCQGPRSLCSSWQHSQV